MRMAIMKKNSGVISMLTILILAGVLVQIVIVALAIAMLSGEQGLGLKSADQSLYAARAGIHDALLRIIRDKTFVPSTNPYTVAVPGGSASVNLTRTLPDASRIQYVIVSTGSAGLKKLKITDTVIVDDLTGSILGQSMLESGL